MPLIMFIHTPIVIDVSTNGANSINFLRDILPTSISSLALLVSVLAPYLIVRYEKVFTRNKEHKEFLRKIELFILEWLNITSENKKIIEEFINVLKTPKGIFPKTFQLYEFPPLEFFNTYNIDLLNECYVIVRRLKNFNHHLQVISEEYTSYRRMLIEKEEDKIENATEFYIQSLEDIKKHCPKIFTDLEELRIIVTLLLKRTNDVQGLTFSKFFNLDPQKDLWHKKDILFTEGEVEAERADMGRKKAEYSKRKSPLS